MKNARDNTFSAFVLLWHFSSHSHSTRKWQSLTLVKVWPHSIDSLLSKFQWHLPLQVDRQLIVKAKQKQRQFQNRLSNLFVQIYTKYTTVRICYSVGLWFSKIYHYNRCIITSDVHNLRSNREHLFPSWAYPWKIYKIPNSMGCWVVFEHFSL